MNANTRYTCLAKWPDSAKKRNIIIISRNYEEKSCLIEGTEGRRGDRDGHRVGKEQKRGRGPRKAEGTRGRGQ